MNSTNNTLSFADTTALKNWLSKTAKQYGLKFLLAHADDGVIWGCFDGEEKKLRTSNDAFSKVSPLLNPITLQQARVFGDNGEVLLVRDGQSWKTYTVTKADEANIKTADENQFLWGTKVAKSVEGFSLLEEGAQGMRQAIPLVDFHPRAILVVRHHIQYDDCGQARIVKSRLVELETKHDGGER